MAGIKDFFSRFRKPRMESQVTTVQTSPTESTTIQQAPRDSFFNVPTRLSALSKLREGVPFEKAMPLTMVALMALMVADLATLYFRSMMIPTGAPPAKKQNNQNSPYHPLSEYSDVLARNIFNSDGFIPEVQLAQAPQLDMNTARESSLPLTLLGTIVHANPGKSVATIQLKGNAEKVLPYIPNDDIEGMATLIKVIRKKAFIRNLSAGTLEYIQIKDDSTFTFSKKSAVVQDGPVKKEGDNNFSISRNDLEAQMTNLPQLLTEARAVPNLVPGGNGKIDGYRILDVVENSLFSKLGIKTGDIIKGVDGEPVDSPAKAMELYNSLKSKNQVKLTMERNGQTSTITYNIQ